MFSLGVGGLSGSCLFKTLLNIPARALRSSGFPVADKEGSPRDLVCGLVGVAGRREREGVLSLGLRRQCCQQMFAQGTRKRVSGSAPLQPPALLLDFLQYRGGLPGLPSRAVVRRTGFVLKEALRNILCRGLAYLPMFCHPIFPWRGSGAAQTPLRHPPPMRWVWTGSAPNSLLFPAESSSLNTSLLR